MRQLMCACAVLLWGLPAARAQPGAAPEEPEAAGEADGEERTFETMGLGPAMLAIPSRPELGRPGLVDLGAGAVSYRKVRMLGPNAGWETVMALVVHDEDVLVDLWDWYTEGDRRTITEKWTALGLGWLFFPIFAGSSQLGFGAFLASSPEPPFIHASGGLMFTPLLFRLNQPGMKFDVASGVYGGVGVMLTRSFGFSARISYDALLFHQLAERGYGHVWTGLATLDFKPPEKKKKRRKLD